MSSNKRDENRVPNIAGVDSITFEGSVEPAVNSSTHALLVESDIQPLSTLYNGTKTVPTGTAQTIASSQSISSVTIKALSTNTVSVYIGNASVTTDNGFEIRAGDAVSLDIDNLSSIYCISGSASQVIRYIAL